MGGSGEWRGAVTGQLWAVLAWWRARWKSVGRNRIARSEQDSIGRVAADWETCADDAGNSKGCVVAIKFSF